MSKKMVLIDILEPEQNQNVQETVFNGHFEVCVKSKCPRRGF